MAKRVLEFALWALGASAILIGLSNFLLGPVATARFFKFVLALADQGATPSSTLALPDVDSELRFYAVFWIGYGALLIDAGRNLGARLNRVPLLLGAFFAGGVGRLLSLQAVGAPHALFVVLMGIELALPILLFGAWLLARRR